MRITREHGFTLIELVVTLTVAVVLVTLAVPSFRSMIDKSRLRGATDGIANVLDLARSNAVKLGHDINVAINTQNGTNQWCIGAISGTNPATPGNQVTAPTACDCNNASTCVVGDLPLYKSYSSYGTSSSYVSITQTDSKIASTGAGNGGLTFTAKFGSIDLANLPSTPLVTLVSPSGKYSTHICASALGPTYACYVGNSFISGYPQCTSSC